MPRFWTCYWTSATWKPSINTEGELVNGSGSNSFTTRGVSPGDVAYIVSVSDGQLFLGGRMTVKKIVTRAQAVRLLGSRNLYDADEWIVDPDEEGTPLDLHRRLSPSVTKQLRFQSKSSTKELCFVSPTELDRQAIRGVRELTPESALLFDRILVATDSQPRTGQMVTVTDDMIQPGVLPNNKLNLLLDETAPGTAFREGSRYQVLVNAYERSPEARRRCVEIHGTTCCICGFNFGEIYGPAAEGFVHIHHLRPLAEVGEEYEVDPVADLRPVCPNCHAVVHLLDPCRSIEEVRRMVEDAKQPSPPFGS